MAKIYITRKMPAAEELLKRHYDTEVNFEDRILTRDELKRVVRDFDGVLTTLADKVDKEILDQAKQMKVISNCAAGLDNVDVQVAKGRKIAVFNVPNATTESTADMTFAILLSLIRFISLHVPLTPETKGLINKDSIKKMKQKPVIVNAENLIGYFNDQP